MPPRRMRRAQNGRPAAPKQHPGTAGELVSLPTVPQAEESKILECPICMSIPLPPVYSCPIGHTICGTCKTHVKKCSFCKLNFGNKCRNYVMESLINAAEFQCRHDGCDQVLRGDQMEAHIAVCSHNPDRQAAPVDNSDAGQEVVIKDQLPDVIANALQSVSLQPDPIPDSLAVEADSQATSEPEAEELLRDDPDSGLSLVQLADSALPSFPSRRSRSSEDSRSRSRSLHRGSSDGEESEEEEESSSRSNSDEEGPRASHPQARGRTRARRRRRRKHYFY